MWASICSWHNLFHHLPLLGIICSKVKFAVSQGGEATDEDIDGIGKVHALEAAVVDLVLAIGQLRPLHLSNVSLGAGVPGRDDGVLKMRFLLLAQAVLIVSFFRACLEPVCWLGVSAIFAEHGSTDRVGRKFHVATCPTKILFLEPPNQVLK